MSYEWWPLGQSEVIGSGQRLQELEIHLWTFGPNGRVTRFTQVLDRHAQRQALLAVGA